MFLASCQLIQGQHCAFCYLCNKGKGKHNQQNRMSYKIALSYWPAQKRMPFLPIAIGILSLCNAVTL